MIYYIWFSFFAGNAFIAIYHTANYETSAIGNAYKLLYQMRKYDTYMGIPVSFKFIKH